MPIQVSRSSRQQSHAATQRKHDLDFSYGRRGSVHARDVREDVLHTRGKLVLPTSTQPGRIPEALLTSLQESAHLIQLSVLIRIVLVKHIAPAQQAREHVEMVAAVPDRQLGGHRARRCAAIALDEL